MNFFVKTFIVTLFLVGQLSPVFACNFGSTHPVLWHYNQTDKVFIGTVIKVGDPRKPEFSYREKATNLPTYKIRLVIEASYRGALPDTLDIGKIALAQINFVEGETYLVYANFNKTDSIYDTGSVLHVLDARMSRHQVLKEIAKNPNGKVVEYNPTTGEKWAEGAFINGIPVGEWRYYELTGELKEIGKYDKDGLRHGVWKSFFVTDQNAFLSFQGIAKGRSSQYEFIKLETIEDPKSIYTYEITFTDRLQNKTVTTQYLYKNPRVQRFSKFKHGSFEGKDKFYDDNGELVSFQTWKNNKKNGRYKFVQVQQANSTVLKTVIEGVYKNDEIVEEIIYYFENGKLSGTEVLTEKR